MGHRSPDRRAKPLLTLAELERSEVVANAAMNRTRALTGINSYTRELKLDVLAWLAVRRAPRRVTRWLDLCCGEGRALRDAATALEAERGGSGAVELVGADLEDLYDPPRGFRFVRTSVHEWSPEATCDLITCVHGLHYVGDKLGLIERVGGWLEADGLFVANLDLSDIRDRDGVAAPRKLMAAFRQSGITYDARRHLLRIEGRRQITFRPRFLGAADDVGPNYSGQPSVRSYYDLPGG